MWLIDRGTCGVLSGVERWVVCGVVVVVESTNAAASRQLGASVCYPSVRPSVCLVFRLSVCLVFRLDTLDGMWLVETKRSTRRVPRERAASGRAPLSPSPSLLPSLPPWVVVERWRSGGGTGVSCLVSSSFGGGTGYRVCNDDNRHHEWCI